MDEALLTYLEESLEALGPLPTAELVARAYDQARVCDDFEQALGKTPPALGWERAVATGLALGPDVDLCLAAALSQEYAAWRLLEIGGVGVVRARLAQLALEMQRGASPEVLDAARRQAAQSAEPWLGQVHPMGTRPWMIVQTAARLDRHLPWEQTLTFGVDEFLDEYISWLHRGLVSFRGDAVSAEQFDIPLSDRYQALATATAWMFALYGARVLLHVPGYSRRPSEVISEAAQAFAQPVGEAAFLRGRWGVFAHELQNIRDCFDDPLPFVDEKKSLIDCEQPQWSSSFAVYQFVEEPLEALSVSDLVRGYQGCALTSGMTIGALSNRGFVADRRLGPHERRRVEIRQIAPKGGPRSWLARRYELKPGQSETYFDWEPVVTTADVNTRLAWIRAL